MDRWEALDHWLGRPREKDRELIPLRYQPGAKTAEIADVLGKTKAVGFGGSGVDAHLGRGRMAVFRAKENLKGVTRIRQV